MQTSLTTTPEQYAPAISETGLYIDSNPYMKNGLRCACTGNSHVYPNRASFATHKKTQRHRNWLARINADRKNYYVQLQEAERTVRIQRIQLAEQSNEVARLQTDITAYRLALEPGRTRPVPTTHDLITFD